MWRTISSLAIWLLCCAFWSQTTAAGTNSAGALVLVNSNSEYRFDFERYLKLYLDYFDVAYTLCDIARQQLPTDFNQAALLILGHDGVSADLDVQAQARLRNYLDSGGGVFSFDTHLQSDTPRPHIVRQWLELKLGEAAVIDEAVSIQAVDSSHYITRLKADRPPLKTVPARRVKVRVPRVTAMHSTAKTLVMVGDAPLVIAGSADRGRIVQWSTYRWLDANILGFYNGLDDVVWRSLVWAARKPFVFQGNIPLVSMRIDDCAGLDMDFAYIDTISKYGIVPHIAFMMDDVPPSAAGKLGEYTRAGKAEAFIHARRREGYTGFFFWDFDFNDYHKGKPFSDEVLGRNFAEMEAFHRRYGIQYARTVTPHYTQTATNTLPYLREMGVEFEAISPATMPYSGNHHFWPYELYQRAGYFDIPFTSYGDGNFTYRSAMVLDWVEKESSIFCSTSRASSIKADWLRPSRAPGYEDSRKVEGLIIDGINMLRLSLDSMGHAFFFTHELNIGLLEGGPDRLDRAFAGVMENLRKYHRIIPCSFDHLNRYGKNIRTADLESAGYNPVTKTLEVAWRGFADMPTQFHVFTEVNGEIKDTWAELPVYRGPIKIVIKNPGI